MGADRAVQLKTDALPRRRTRGREGARRRAEGRRLRSRPVRQARVRHVGRRRRHGDGGAARTAVRHRGRRSSTSPNGRGSATRDLEGAAEIVEFPLPAVVTIDEGIARPRYPSLKGIMAAKKKPLESKPAQLGAVRVTVQKAELPPERPAGRIIGEGVGRRAGARSASPDRSEGALMANVLVFAETRGTALRKVALEAVTRGACARRRVGWRRSARARRRRVRASARRAEQLGAHGADVVLRRRARGARDVRARVDRGDGGRAREAGRLSRRGARLLDAGARPRAARSPRSSMRRSRRT